MHHQQQQQQPALSRTHILNKERRCGKELLLVPCMMWRHWSAAHEKAPCLAWMEDLTENSVYLKHFCDVFVEWTTL